MAVGEGCGAEPACAGHLVHVQAHAEHFGCMIYSGFPGRGCNYYPILLLGKLRFRRLDYLRQQVALLRKQTLLTSAQAARKEGG